MFIGIAAGTSAEKSDACPMLFNYLYDYYNYCNFLPYYVIYLVGFFYYLFIFLSLFNF